MSTVVDLHTYAAPMDHSYSRHSNSAGAPLPHIPRRTTLSRPTTPFSSYSAPTSPRATISRVLSADPAVPRVPPPSATVRVVPSTVPQEPAPDEASSSESSSTESYVQMNPRAKRVRRPKLQPFRSAADSAPVPQAKTTTQSVGFPAKDSNGDDTPRASTSLATPKPMLSVVLGDTKTPSTSQAISTRPLAVRTDATRSASTPHMDAAKAARKKSGEPLKSSLKSRRPAARGALSVVTAVSSTTKSEPSTPMKSVHFDAHLEHVKLFLAEQKPLAISREGSPTDDTSGTESDFPSSIFGPTRVPEEEKMLIMTVTNMPAVLRADADVALEEFILSEDGLALNGRVRVRNIAFEKWVAVRFTVDYWQTTSEVTAKYLDSVPGGVFDRFTFTIRLGDMLARIEEKTMFFALRFNVVGREIWDNNGNLNYKVVFAKVARPAPASPSTPDMASLKSKLEHVAKGQEAISGSMPSRKANTFTLQASTSLRTRYDFAASLRAPWKRPPPTSTTPTKSGHGRPMSYPNFQKVGKQATYESVRQAITRSPRILDPDSPGPTERSSPVYVTAANAGAASPKMAEADVGQGIEESPVTMMSRRRGRNHQRGYFDPDCANSPLSSPSMKRTPTGSPVGARLSKTLELIAHEGGEREREVPVWLALKRGGSEESTPTETSNSESSLQSSPSASPREDKESVFGFAGARNAEGESYSSFLNKYCYYTGNEGAFSDCQLDVICRSQSLSNVEEFLSTSPCPSYMISSGDTPTRSPSYDDVVSVSSGSTTPTIRTAGLAALVDSSSMVSAAREL
ncbi:putative phosphatase regulatory subunit-domain-containing protein [Ganoderma leucocontextum]|nr:putative phosphatase regulatory subunit-domain-containing protein [Ganoderma leucocontextum]